MAQVSLAAKVSSTSAQFPEHWKVSSNEEVNGVPFTHLVIDNFFTEDEFNEIKRHEADVKDKEIKIAHSLIKKNGEIKSDLFDADFLTGINQRYLPALQAMLSVLSKGKTSLYEYSDFHLISTGPNYEHAIHDDIPKKLLSVVFTSTRKKTTVPLSIAAAIPKTRSVKSNGSQTAHLCSPDSIERPGTLTPPTRSTTVSALFITSVPTKRSRPIGPKVIT